MPQPETGGAQVAPRSLLLFLAEGQRAVPPAVPSSALFSKTGVVVHWSACLEPETDQTENIEVPGSHCGLGSNPLVLYAIVDRLS